MINVLHLQQHFSTHLENTFQFILQVRCFFLHFTQMFALYFGLLWRVSVGTHTKLTEIDQDSNPVILDSEREKVVAEAMDAMRHLVVKGWLNTKRG